MVSSALAVNSKKMLLTLPDRFAVSVIFKKHDQAHRASFFPGVKKVGVNQVKISCKNWIDVLAFIHFTFSTVSCKFTILRVPGCVLLSSSALATMCYGLTISADQGRSLEIVSKIQ
jgi:hypothetical protein